MTRRRRIVVSGITAVVTAAVIWIGWTELSRGQFMLLLVALGGVLTLAEVLVTKRSK